MQPVQNGHDPLVQDNASDGALCSGCSFPRLRGALRPPTNQGDRSSKRDPKVKLFVAAVPSYSHAECAG
jgi:hypothetical protein